MFQHIGEMGETPEQRLYDEALKERFFERLVEGSIYDTWEKEMTAARYEKKDIEEFREAFVLMPEEDQEQMLAIPWSLRKKIIPHLLKAKKEKGTSMNELLSQMMDAHRKFDRRIAYHTSADKINPRLAKAGLITEEQWGIDGTEKDHRDEDRPMAYYSFDYKHLYREKNPNYIYFVTASLHPVSGHRTDGKVWGRANKLDIIDRLDLREVDAKLMAMINKYNAGEKDGDIDQRVQSEVKKHNLAA